MASRKQRAFVEEYLTCWNAAEAARRVGYSEKTARQIGNKLLTKVDISEAIQSRLAEVHMSADEALKLLADIARGDMGEIMDVTSMGFNLDMQEAKRKGLTKLIKKIKQTTTTKIGRKQDDDDEERTTLEVELYAADAAIRDVLKVHGKFVDRTDLTSGGKPIESGIDDDRYDRALSTLADAIREVLPGSDAKKASEMDTAE
jgi:phage terminase small subunit